MQSIDVLEKYLTYEVVKIKEKTTYIRYMGSYKKGKAIVLQP